jgi:hypothetical protein
MCRGALNDAERQLLSAASDTESPMRLLSIVFAVPLLRAGGSEVDPEERNGFREAVEALVDARRATEDQHISAGAWAWSFPDAARSLRGIRRPQVFYPGVMMIVREVTRAPV